MALPASDMSLWSADDPYGVATLRKILLTLSLFFVVFGAYRTLSADDPYGPFLVAAILVLVVGLFLERVLGMIRRRNRDG